MPDYEYRCLACRKKFDVFMTYAEYGTKPVACPACGSSDVQRRIGRVRVAHSDHARLETMADPANMAALDEDPRALGRMMRQMSSELGENMGPEFNEVVNRLEKGQSPDQIERELPDIGDSLGSGPGAGDSGGFGDLN
jgi:putative FmdB family regulatory protein